ncbi:MAG: iron-containing alcohol dehydrogenase, partial [Candidatus Bathyarchaeia archaeon]
ANLEKHARIAELLEEPKGNLSLRSSAFRCAVGFKKLLQDLDMPTSLQAVGVTQRMIPSLARNVFRSPKHVARNPRKVTVESLIELFTNAYDGHLESNGELAT